MNDLEFRPSFKMMSDWELAERQAFSQCFDMVLLGCLFHLGHHFFFKKLVFENHYLQGKLFGGRFSNLVLPPSM